MTTILTYGDSNTWGMAPLLRPGRPERLAPDLRWPGVLAARAAGARIVEEGLNGRTTCLDDPVDGALLNGLTHLPVALASHAPIDLVIIGLGTNDLKHRFSMLPGDICGGIRNLVATVARSEAGPGGRAPAILVLAPPALGPMSLLAETFQGGAEKSRALGPAVAAMGQGQGLDVIEVGRIVEIVEGDGVHLDAAQHRALGEAVAGHCAHLL